MAMVMVMALGRGMLSCPKSLVKGAVQATTAVATTNSIWLR